jgi:hypothetical protein
MYNGHRLLYCPKSLRRGHTVSETKTRRESSGTASAKPQPLLFSSPRQKGACPFPKPQPTSLPPGDLLKRFCDGRREGSGDRAQSCGWQERQVSGIERKMRRNLLLSMEFYDEATDEMEWSAHSYIFDKAPAAAPAPPATTPAPPAPVQALPPIPKVCQTHPWPLHA